MVGWLMVVVGFTAAMGGGFGRVSVSCLFPSL